MAGVLHLWNEWEVHILVLVSFVLQVLLLIIGGVRWRIISRVLVIPLWLMYLLADSTAVYTIGHMSIGYKPGEHQQLMAFWAPFLLVHLGGQDTITAYTMQDNQLWRRHLLTFVIQALGAAYVIYKNISSHGPLFAPAVLILVIGILKNGERLWALSSSSLESISNFLDNVDIEEKDGPYSARMHLVEHAEGIPQGRTIVLDEEVILQGAHDLLYICMGQFVDDKIWPSLFQMDALKLFDEKCSTHELIGMQLSLIHDIFYTKATVIHTWYGCCIRAISLLGTVTTFFLFQFSTVKDGYNRVDVVVTNILLSGASILEVASVLRAMVSTWTCATLKARGWDWLHSLLVSLRRFLSMGQGRRWSGFIGQRNLIDSDTRNIMISKDTMEKVQKEICRMVVACGGSEDMMRSYRGQCAMKQHDGLLEDLTWSTSMNFDDCILAWHLATNEFIKLTILSDADPLVKATKALSNYMMFLFMTSPYMLPPPVRPRLYAKA